MAGSSGRTDDGVYKLIGRRLADLLQEAPVQPVRRNAGQRDISGIDEPMPGEGADKRALLEHLKNTLRDQPEVVAGRVNFVNLDRIKDRLGDRWAKLVERADDIARRVIEHHMSGADMYTVLPGMRYLITFGDLSPEEARIKSAVIAENIAKMLLNEDTDGLILEVQSAIASMDKTLEVKKVKSIDDMVEKIYRITFRPPSIKDKRPDRVSVKKSISDDPLMDIQLVYRPMWDLSKNVVSTYIYIPAIPQSDGTLLVGEAGIVNIEDVNVKLKLDMMILNKAIDDLTDIRASGDTKILGIPLHFESVSTTRSRTEYTNLCKMIPKDLRKLLIFELVGTSSEVSNFHLLEITKILKNYSRSVLLRLQFTDPKFRPFGETGISVVGVDLSSETISERKLIKAFDRFCEDAQQIGLQTYAHGLRTMSLTTAAIGAGFSYIDGDTIQSVSDDAGSLYRFDTRKFVRNWVKSVR